MYNRLDTIPVCDRQTDRRTDGQTDMLPRHSPRYSYASRGKNRTITLLHQFQHLHVVVIFGTLFNNLDNRQVATVVMETTHAAAS